MIAPNEDTRYKKVYCNYGDPRCPKHVVFDGLPPRTAPRSVMVVGRILILTLVEIPIPV